MANPFDHLSIWAIYTIQVIAFVMLAELGYLLGIYVQQHTKDQTKLPKSTSEATILALLAFLLAFTFSMGSSRFDTRKNLVVKEVNAIGTAYLRASLLPDPQRQKCKTLLREYVRDRSTTRIDYSEVMQFDNRSQQVHEQLWDQVVSLKSNDDYAKVSILFIPALNEVFDLHTMRFNSYLRNRIPMGIWLTLYTIAILGMLLKGYSDGLAGKKRSLFAGVILMLAFSAVLLLIQDLDRPLSDTHLIEAGKQAMVDLLQTMKAP